VSAETRPRPLGRLLTAMVTPFERSLGVDYAAAERLAGLLVAEGSDGIVVADVIGQGPSLADEEKVELVRRVRSALPDGATVVAVTGGADTRRTIDLSRRAAAAGADAVVCPPPAYGFLARDTIDRHYRAVAEESGVPVVMQHAPARTGFGLPAASVFMCSHLARIAGVWDASGDLAGVATAGAQSIRHPDGIPRVWCGDELFVLPALAAGAYGAVSSVTHVAGRTVRGLIDSFLAGEGEQTARVYAALFALIQSLDLARGNPAPLKAAIEPLGVIEPYHRPPVLPLSREESADIAQAVRDFAHVMSTGDRMAARGGS
jgi:4-hydroxy-tetrahydrodipicolinate synthase